jgi:hypothetical protein
MATIRPRRSWSAAAVLLIASFAILLPGLRTPSVSARPLAQQSATTSRPQTEVVETGPPDFERAIRQQADTDRVWAEAARGVMQMEKISYRSRVGDLDIPAFVFRPLRPRQRGRSPPSSGCTKTCAVIFMNISCRTSARP